MIGILLLIPGILLLMKGADFFVESASSIANKLKIAPIVIGLTVVAFGTSLPELIVNFFSAINGNTDIALGNIVGSNIANILLILGLSSVITPLIVKHNTVWKEIPMSFLATILLFIFALQQKIDDGKIMSLIGMKGESVVGHITLTHGIFLLFIFIIFLYYTFGIAKEIDGAETKVTQLPLSKSVIYLVMGLGTVTIGGKFVVEGAVAIAKYFGISESFLGLTIVAVGTSLPELVTNIIAARKGYSDIAVGNVIGSNIFNIFFILGATAVIRPIPVSLFSVFDLVFLLFVTTLTFVFLFLFEKYKVAKIEGAIMLTLYISYIVYLIFRK